MEPTIEAAWSVLQKLDQEYCAFHNPADFDIDEAKISALEEFLEKPNTDVPLAFRRYMKRERARRLHVRARREGE